MGGNETTVEDKLDRHPLCAAAAGVPSIFAWPWSNCGSWLVWAYSLVSARTSLQHRLCCSSKEG